MSGERARTLVLLRHGRTAYNAAGRAQGHLDVGLDERGRAQAADVATYLARAGPAALWSSDLARARETCGFLEQATGLVATLDPRLREYDVGARQGMTMPEFRAAFPEAYDAWRAGEDLVRVPGSEGVPEVAARMLPALGACLDALASGQTGVVVTHGACLKVGVLAMLGWPQSVAATLQGVDNCAWVTLREREPDAPLRLVHYNRQADRDDTGLGIA